MKTIKKSAPIFFLLSLIFISDISAQTEIFGFGGYMLSSRVPVREGDLQVNDKPNYGLGVDFQIEHGLQIELLWISEQTSVRLRRFLSDITDDPFDLSIHYFQAGAIYELGRGKIRPFGSMSAGVSLFQPSDASREKEWFAAATLGGGVKIDVSNNAGIRLQGRILMPVIFSRASLWVGTGGVGIGAGSWTPLIQFDITAGVYIRIGGNK